MIVGVPKEIKVHEYRVGLVPQGAHALVQAGCEVYVQKDAGLGIGISDEDYKAAGAKILDTAEEIFAKAEMIIKVKEPQPQECKMLRPDQLLFTYLHLAPDPEQTKALMASGCIAVAYETVTDHNGGLPLLAPMSEVAGRMSVQCGAHALEKAQGGRGVLLGGVPGVQAGKVVILGGGVAGLNAAQMAVGMHADVTIFDVNTARLAQIDTWFDGKIQTMYSTAHSVTEHVLEADLVIGAVLIPGAAAPKLVTKETVSKMKKGSVLVDIAIDQGGCFETSHATTHKDPTFLVEGVVHYCVANMPGAVARTSTFALNNATLPFTLQLVKKGLKKALTENHHLLNGLNIYKGKVTCKPVCDALNLPFTDPSTLFV